MRASRQSTGYLNMRPDTQVDLAINDATRKDAEIWTVLEYYSEIDEVREDLIKKFCITNSKKRVQVSKNFQSFVRQAKNYYFTAKKLPNSSSALLYYYSFLNLAKAYLVLEKPQEILTKSGKVQHGLYDSMKRNSKFQKEEVFVSGGIFKILYEIETGETLKNKTALSISNLLGYCTDITFQYERGGFGGRKNARGSMAVFVDTQRKKSWATLAFGDFSILEKYKKRIKKFNSAFERVDLNKNLALQVFGITGPQRMFFTFYEGKEFDLLGPSEGVPTWSIDADLLSTFGKMYVPNHYNDKHCDFYIAKPYALNNQLLMNEFLAMYIIMFYLSSLVRYQPYYMDKILGRKESWLINSFIETCPQLFLIYIVSKIAKVTYSFSQR